MGAGGSKMTNASNPKTQRAIPIFMLITLSTLNSIKAQSQEVRPIADAGSSRYAASNPVMLDGSGSYDPDNSGFLSYEWRQISGPNAIIIDANTPTPIVGGSMQTGTGRDKTPKLSGFAQIDAVQVCEFELIVSDGELQSLPETVEVIIVPYFGVSLLELRNNSFDPNKPTIIYFGGGNCTNGLQEYSSNPLTHSGWLDKANIINFPKGYYPDHSDPQTYFQCGDMIITYLSSVAPNYRQLIQISGWSTGGKPAIDVGRHLNLTYKDRRYAINRVTFFDTTPYCQNYTNSISDFLNSAVDGEQCWIDNYVSSSSYTGNVKYPFFYNNILNIWFEKGADSSAYGSEEWFRKHRHAQEWYNNSLINRNMNNYNSGIVAGAYWSVIGPGKNLQLASTPNTQTYKFEWYGWNPYGYMDFYDESSHPGQMLEPITLIGPENSSFVDANGAVLSCEESENAIGYQLLFGTDPYRVMDYLLISDTPNPPVGTIIEFPFEQTWWTIKVYDSFGSTIYADPRWINAAVVSPATSTPSDGKYGSGTGELDNPYLIYTAEQLNALSAEPNDWDKHFKLMADIDLAGYSYDAAIIAPDADPCDLDFQGASFKGVFDGNGHTISNLTITGEHYLALFGRLEYGAQIKNLSVVNVNITGTDYVAGIVGFSKGNIEASYCTGKVSGNRFVGGLTGRNWSAINVCYNAATVIGHDDVGGLAAGNYGSITNSYNTGTVTSTWDAGGLVGANNGSISMSYSTGTVGGDNRAGGLVGYNNWDYGIITSSFWDVEASGLSTSDGGTGKTTAEMHTASTFLDAGWDLLDETDNGTEDIWLILEGQDYPRLWWENDND
jgi:hypothetical protein